MTEDELQEIEERAAEPGSLRRVGVTGFEAAQATFIVHARIDLPALCAEVRRLRAGLVAMEIDCDRFADQKSRLCRRAQQIRDALLSGEAWDA